MNNQFNHTLPPPSLAWQTRLLRLDDFWWNRGQSTLKRQLVGRHVFSVDCPGDNDRNWLSWAGRRGYRAPPGNQFLIDVSRLEKYHRKRFAMLKSWQNVPHTVFMQITDAITGKYTFRHILANSAHSSTIKLSNPMFWGSKSIIKLFLKWSDVSNTCYCAKYCRH